MPADEHPIRLATRADFDDIYTHLETFWGSDRTSDRTRHLHHPMWLEHFGNSAYVIPDAGGRVAAYLFGFLSQTQPVGYVHLIAVRQDCQGQGLGRRLYGRFIAFAREHNCTAVRAITTPENRASIAFHRAIGMTLLGDPNADGIPVVKDYSGPGLDRVVFHLAV